MSIKYCVCLVCVCLVCVCLVCVCLVCVLCWIVAAGEGLGFYLLVDYISSSYDVRRLSSV